MDEMPRNKRSLELTTKGKVLVGIVVVLILGAIIFFVVMNNNKSDDTSKLLDDARLAITVTPDKSKGASMTLSPGNESSAGISVGGSATLTYSFDTDTTSKVKWIISDTSVVKEEDGVLTALKAGTVEIYAVAADNEKVKSNTVTLSINR